MQGNTTFNNAINDVRSFTGEANTGKYHLVIVIGGVDTIILIEIESGVSELRGTVFNVSDRIHNITDPITGTSGHINDGRAAVQDYFNVVREYDTARQVSY